MKSCFIIILFCTILCSTISIAQIRPYIHGNLGFQHLITPSDTFKTNNSPLYTVGLGATINNFGLELSLYSAKYKSKDFNYHYLNPDFYFTDETYKQVFTRKGIDATLNYHHSLSPKFVLWAKAGGSYYQFKPSIETKDNNVRDEIQSFETYWKKYNKLMPVGTLRLSYSPIRYTNFYVEGGYDLAMFKVGLLIGNVGKAYTKKKKQEKNTNDTKPTQTSTTPPTHNSKLKFKNGKFKGVEWEPISITNNQIYSSFLVATNLNNQMKSNANGNLLGFNINSKLKNFILNWEIECSDKTILNTQKGVFNSNNIAGNNFKPTITWNYSALKKMNASSNTVLTYRLIDPNTGNKVEKTQSILIRNINEWMITQQNNNYESLFTILIDDNNLEVEKLTKKVTETKMVDAIRGYKRNTTDVTLQVASVWRVLNEMGFEFKQPNIDLLENNIKNVSVQTIDKVVKAKKGNTIEGAIIFSSILRNMGIRSALIFCNGKCLLGYYTDEKPNFSLNILDLTFISSNTFTSNPKSSVQSNKETLADIPKSIKLSDLNKAYYLELINAMAEGHKQYELIQNKDDKSQLNILDINSLKKEFETLK